MKNSTISKLHVCYVTPYYFPSMGGLQSAAKILFEGMRKNPHIRCTLITSKMDSNNNLLVGEDEYRNDILRVGYSKSIKFLKLDGLETLKNPWKLTTIRAHYRRLFLHLEEFDVVYFFGPYYFKIPALFILIKDKVSVIFRIFNSIGVNDVKEHLELLKAPNVYFHTISKQLTDDLICLGLPNNRIFYCPNTVDTDFFKPQSKSHQLDISKPRFLYFGRLDYYKGIPKLIELFCEIKKYFEYAKLTVIGSTADNTQRILIEKLKGQHKDITWLEEQPHNSLIKYINEHDFYITASKIEGMSNSLLEAMSAGLCPIAPSSTYGVLDLIKPGKNGFTYDLEKEGFIDLIEKLRYLTPEEYLSMSREARDTVLKNFSKTRVLYTHYRFYTKIRANFLKTANACS